MSDLTHISIKFVGYQPVLEVLGKSLFFIVHGHLKLNFSKHVSKKGVVVNLTYSMQ